MNDIELRELSRLVFFNPSTILLRLQEVRRWLALHPEIPDEVKNLRTNKLKPEREAWAAAIFTFLASEALQTDIVFARNEYSDYDFVCRWLGGGYDNFTPVQLKELVPANLNSQSSIQSIIDKISRKGLYSDRCVAIKLTRQCHFNPMDLNLSGLNVGSLYVFGAVSPDEKSWMIWGDLKECRLGVKVDVPF